MNIHNSFNLAHVPEELRSLFDQAVMVLRAFFPDGEVPPGWVVIAGSREDVAPYLERPLPPLPPHLAYVPRIAVVMPGSKLARGVAAWAAHEGKSAGAARVCGLIEQSRELLFVFPMKGGFHLLSPELLDLRANASGGSA